VLQTDPVDVFMGSHEIFSEKERAQEHIFA